MEEKKNEVLEIDNSIFLFLENGDKLRVLVEKDSTTVFRITEEIENEEMIQTFHMVDFCRR